MDYLVESARTLPPNTQFHGQLVPGQWFASQLRASITALNSLDAIKKALFYGKDKDGALESLFASGSYTVGGQRMSMEHQPGQTAMEPSAFIDYIHAVLGIATEASELLEALQSVLDGEPVDGVNIKEEVGDLFWYQAILARNFDFTFSDCQEVNIAKLRKRFPDRFDAHQANNRDLEAERAVLERLPDGISGDNVIQPERVSTNWPLPSFDAKDWAKAFCNQFLIQTRAGHLTKPVEDDEGLMLAWFANALMRGYDEHASRYQCQDEGCPHYGTAHGHDVSSVVNSLCDRPQLPVGWVCNRIKGHSGLCQAVPADEAGRDPPDQGCTLPAPGWYCSREPGHEGPCAARQITV